jgi:hypothetical protein
VVIKEILPEKNLKQKQKKPKKDNARMVYLQHNVNYSTFLIIDSSDAEIMRQKQKAALEKKAQEQGKKT